jgi:hypothetical protein
MRFSFLKEEFYFLIELDMKCGLKTIPVRCPNNHCLNQGLCHVDMLKNLS